MTLTCSPLPLTLVCQDDPYKRNAPCFRLLTLELGTGRLSGTLAVTLPPVSTLAGQTVGDMELD